MAQKNKCLVVHSVDLDL